MNTKDGVTSEGIADMLLLPNEITYAVKTAELISESRSEKIAGRGRFIAQVQPEKFHSGQ